MMLQRYAKVGVLGVLGLLALSMQACTSARSMKVTSEVGPHARFDPRAGTFTWMAESDPSSGDWKQVPYARVRFRELVQSGLEAKGYEYKPDGPADRLLSDRLTRHVMDDPMHENKDLRYAMLALDVLDARTWQVTWRASADLELGPATSREKVDATIGEVVRRILKPIPARVIDAKTGTAP
jgi:hypothetical protein